jgi:hypothetical protein
LETEVTTVTLSVNTTGLAAGIHQTQLSIHAESAAVPTRILPVTLRVGPLLVPSQYATLEAAIDAAVEGDEIELAPGTYAPASTNGIRLNGKAITIRSQNPDDEAIVKSTIVDSGTQTGFRLNGKETPATVIAGLTFRGYGVFCDGSSPTIRNCRFDHVSVGINYYSQARVIGCIIWGSDAGIKIWDSSPILENCEIYENGREMASAVGGIYCTGSQSDALITNCIIRNNISTCYAAGIVCQNGAKASVYSSTLENNRENAVDGGGGAVNLYNCIIRNNQGGAVVSDDGDIVNCLVTANYSGLGYCDGRIVNCTIANNQYTGQYSGSGLATCRGQIINCIVWGNGDHGVISEGTQIGGEAGGTFFNCCIQGWSGKYPGTGNFSADPGFVNPSGNNYALQPSSICIDRGGAIPGDLKVYSDLAGNGRIADGNGDNNPVVDVGAYERMSANPQPLLAVSSRQFSFAAFEARSNPAVNRWLFSAGGRDPLPGRSRRISPGCR